MIRDESGMNSVVMDQKNGIGGVLGTEGSTRPSVNRGMCTVHQWIKPGCSKMSYWAGQKILYLVGNNSFLSGSEAIVSAKPLSFEAQSQHGRPGPAASRDGVSNYAGAWAQVGVRG